jgi:hypothetical protein
VDLATTIQKKTEKQKGGESFCVSGEKIKQVGLCLYESEREKDIVELI